MSPFSALGIYCFLTFYRPKFDRRIYTAQQIFLEGFQKLLKDTQMQLSYSNLWPTLNIASPDLLSALQNWHDGVIWDPTPPLIASDEGMADR